MCRASGLLSGSIALVLFGVVSFLGLAPKAANAHEFVVELQAVGDQRDVILTDALRGFLLATVERDGHANEESNGHLGGLDVYIDLEPASVAARFPELKEPPGDRPDIVAVIGASQDVGDTTGDDSVVLRPGILQDDNDWRDAEALAAESFAARYIAKFGQPASQWAAWGYDAARRIDAAVRPLGGVDDRAALESAFAQTAQGIRW